MSLPEFERENIIATRQEQMHERETRKQVAKMAARTGGPSGGADSDEEEQDEDDDDDEEYSSRGTRSRKAVGASSTKNEGLEKLKRKRAEKGKKKEKKKVSSEATFFHPRKQATHTLSTGLGFRRRLRRRWKVISQRERKLRLGFRS